MIIDLIWGIISMIISMHIDRYSDRIVPVIDAHRSNRDLWVNQPRNSHDRIAIPYLNLISSWNLQSDWGSYRLTLKLTEKVSISF